MPLSAEVVRRSRRMVDRARVGGSLGVLVLMSESTGARKRLPTKKGGVSETLRKQCMENPDSYGTGPISVVADDGWDGRDLMIILARARREFAARKAERTRDEAGGAPN